MSAEIHWCVIVNLQTCSKSEWRKWHALLEKYQIPFQVNKTNSIDELSQVLADLLKKGQRYFLFAGGDGTLHQGGNLLMKYAEGESHEIVIGVLPNGTGNDWVRTFGVSKNKLIQSLQERSTVPLNLLRLQWPDGRIRYAFNMTGGALDATVVDYLNHASLRIPGVVKYPIALLKTLTKPHQWSGTITVDGKKLEGDWLTIQAGFGKYCGGGMYVLPHAQEKKAGLLLMKPKSLGKIIISLPKIYNGKIADQPEAIAMHFSKLEITHRDKPIPFEADGEFLGYTPLSITVMEGVMKRLGSAK